MTFLFCRIKLQEREPVTKITRTKAIDSAPYVVTPEDTFIYYTCTIIFFRLGESLYEFYASLCFA